MRTAADEVDVASDRRRRENVPRHILCSCEFEKLSRIRDVEFGKVKKWKKTVDKTRRHNYNIIYSRLKRYGEIPKRLKGLPWKGSRSLIAARGFKSLFLRFDIYQC